MVIGVGGVHGVNALEIVVKDMNTSHASVTTLSLNMVASTAVVR